MVVFFLRMRFTYYRCFFVLFRYHPWCTVPESGILRLGPVNHFTLCYYFGCVPVYQLEMASVGLLKNNHTSSHSTRHISGSCAKVSNPFIVFLLLTVLFLKVHQSS